MTNFLFVCFVILFGALAGMTIILFIFSLMYFLDGEILNGILSFIACTLIGVSAYLTLQGIRLHDKPQYEIEVKQVQIDTTYTITNSKIDTTYILRYIE